MALPTQVCLATSIPGPRGNDGVGTPGADGLSASTFLTANFVMPAQGSNVTVEVLDSSVFSMFEIVYVAVAGYMQVVGIPDATHLTLLNLRDDTSSGGGGGGGGGVSTIILNNADPDPASGIIGQFAWDQVRKLEFIKDIDGWNIH